jgi:hypothetical protein
MKTKYNLTVFKAGLRSGTIATMDVSRWSEAIVKGFEVIRNSRLSYYDFPIIIRMYDADTHVISDELRVYPDDINNNNKNKTS